MSTKPRPRGPDELTIRGSITAAELAVAEEDWDTARDALQCALAKVNRAKHEGHHE